MEFPDRSKPQQAAPKKKVEAVVPTSTATMVQRPASKRFFGAMFAESPKDLIKRAAITIMLPNMKAGVEQALNAFVSGMLWGDSSNRPANLVRGTVVGGGAVVYQNASNNPSLLAARMSAPQGNVGYQDMLYPTQQYAEIVLANMYDLLNQYSVVTVGDLKELSGKSTSISDNGLGWTSLQGARISSVGSGFVLELPKPTLI